MTKYFNNKNILLILFNYVYFTWNKISARGSFESITDTMLKINNCIPYAYGNFNADKFMDIYCVSNSGKTIEIWLAGEKEDYSFTQYLTVDLVDSQVVNLVPGDFNGDSIIDLLVLHRKSSNDYLTMRLYRGTKTEKYNNNISNNDSIDFNKYKFKDEPLAVDLNGDGIMDVFGEDQNGRNYYFFNETVSVVPQISSKPLFTGYSNVILDANNDYVPDLLITSKDNNKPVYELWLKTSRNSFEFTTSYNPPDDMAVYGQSLFADFDGDGHFEHLLPACRDTDCKNSTIFIYKNKMWHELPIDFNQYKFLVESEISSKINMKVGDFNLDGYTDLLVVMISPTAPKSSAILLENVVCNTNNCMFSRTFNFDLRTYEFDNSNVLTASFFDFYDDGILDLVLVVTNEGADKLANPYKILAYKNQMYDDVFFLKVTVIPGRCGVTNTCPFSILPNGLNYAGSFVKITLESFEYKTFTIYASQLTKSSHLSLQLPFTIFGLGSTANFVDSLKVGIESVNENNISSSETKEFKESIIPNSQLVLSVNPRDNSHYWKMQLFMTLSKNMFSIGLTLCVTMICLIFTILLLYFREKKIDEKERRLESQRFHFDGL